MSLSMLSAMVIAAGGTEASYAGHEDGKWAGLITIPDDRYRILVSTQPVYETKEEATAAMQDVIDQVIAMDEADTLMPCPKAES